MSPFTLANISALFGLLFALTGAGAILQPLPTLKSVFNFNPPTTAASGRRFATSATRMYGVRDLYAGLLTLAIWYRAESDRDRELLGWCMLCAAGVASVDSWASWTELGRVDASHLVVMSVLLVIGWLMTSP